MIYYSSFIVKCVCLFIVYCSLTECGLCSDIEPIGKAKEDEPVGKAKESKSTDNAAVSESTDNTAGAESSDNSAVSESTDNATETESSDNASEANENSSPKPDSSPILEDEQSLKLVVDLMRSIRNDLDYHSYFHMVNEANSEHTIQRHKPNAPFFYTNDKNVLKDIIDMVMSDPNAIIDETKSGVLKVYRDFDYPNELEDIFAKEDPKHRVIPQPKKFQDDYLGVTSTGPTNRVMLTLKIKSDDQNAPAFAQRIAYSENNIVFFDAFPVKGPLPLPTTDEKKSVEKPTDETPTEE